MSVSRTVSGLLIALIVGVAAVMGWHAAGLPVPETLRAGLQDLGVPAGWLEASSGGDPAGQTGDGMRALTEVPATLQSGGQAAATNADSPVSVSRLSALIQDIRRALMPGDEASTKSPDSAAGPAPGGETEVAALEARTADGSKPDSGGRTMVHRDDVGTATELVLPPGDDPGVSGAFGGTPRLATGFATEREQVRVHFPLDQDILTPQAEQTLRVLVTHLNDAEAVHRIRVDGHCDDTGSDDYNQGLSERRAERVRVFLADHGVVARETTTRGHGERVPLVVSENSDARAMNRRAEILIEWVHEDADARPRVAGVDD
jgi:outer membrane protein OmpA-like peptidoglycan-associated protein